jgi:teichuronic acid biosynthesis glycosyltransferase TuaH
MPSPETFDIVCCSLEPWDQVWRRNQLMATELLRLRANLRLLFVETPVDMAWAVRNRQVPALSARRQIGDTGRLWATRPRKWLPRKVWPFVDQSLGSQVLAAAAHLNMSRPVLWINDNTYGPLITRTGWPSVYDVTDDWTLAEGSPEEMARQRRNDARIVEGADEVVVCSPALVGSRGRNRHVHLITNGVDVDHLRSLTTRPADLPAGQIAMYQGTLSAGRLDIRLCVELAATIAPDATLVFVGPNSLDKESEQAVTKAGALILGSRPYADLPGYLQAADVLVVPHQVSPFTESLDPIKAREFLAVGRPVVSTPVAGFRDLGPPVSVAPAESFVNRVVGILAEPALPHGPGPLTASLTTWSDQAAAFLDVLDAAVEEAAGRVGRSRS